MRKIILLAIPLVVILVLGTIFLAISLNRPPGWQDHLEQYLQYKNAEAPWKYEVLFTGKARQPWKFEAEMSLLSFGQSMYKTDFGYEEQASTNDMLSILPKEPRNSSLIALPYPPEEVWCVLLGRENKLESAHLMDGVASLVLVALHQDLYNADYIIHEIAGKSQTRTPAEVAAMIDCALSKVTGLEQEKP